MNLRTFIQLLSLAAIWGASFLFMRISAPVLGASWVSSSRVLLAALLLLVWGLFIGKKLHVRKHARHYLTLGFFNSALPFMLFAYAAQIVSASVLSILNAAAPIWGAVILAALGKASLTGARLLGLCMGISGVAVLVGFDATISQPGAQLAVAAGLGAAFCYGIASTYAASAPAINPFNNAHGSMWASSVLLLPLLLFLPVPSPPPLEPVLSVVLLGLVCTGVAYLLYFNLIAKLGPTSALSVTFIIPVFGVFWGWLLLDETVGWHTLVGALLVLCGTGLVTGVLSFRRHLR